MAGVRAQLVIGVMMALLTSRGETSLRWTNKQSLSDQADLMNALEISRDIDNRFFEVFRILVM